jgi:hypothetical protein
MQAGSYYVNDNLDPVINATSRILRGSELVDFKEYPEGRIYIQNLQVSGSEVHYKYYSKKNGFFAELAQNTEYIQKLYDLGLSKNPFLPNGSESNGQQSYLIDSEHFFFQTTLHALCQWFSVLFYKADHGDLEAQQTFLKLVPFKESSNNKKIYEYLLKSNETRQIIFYDLLQFDSIVQLYSEVSGKPYEEALRKINRLVYANKSNLQASWKSLHKTIEPKFDLEDFKKYLFRGFDSHDVFLDAYKNERIKKK